MDLPAQQQPRWTAVNSEGFASPAALGVDAVVLTVREAELLVLVVERADRRLVLPGGLVAEGDSSTDSIQKTLREKTGLQNTYLEQLATFADPERDPRGWIPSVAYLALVPPATSPTDPAAKWTSAKKLSGMPFDHDVILATALERVSGKLWWSNVAVGILPDVFTLSEARLVYEAISGTAYDPSTFGRDLRATGLIEASGKESKPKVGRPAALYRFRSAEPAWGTGRRKRLTRTTN